MLHASYVILPSGGFAANSGDTIYMKPEVVEGKLRQLHRIPPPHRHRHHIVEEAYTINGYGEEGILNVGIQALNIGSIVY